MILTIVPCRIVRHETQEDTSSVHIEVELPNGDLVGKSEYNVQDLNAKLVYRYWKAQGGRCAITGFTEYRPFKILDYKGRQYGRDLSTTVYLCTLHNAPFICHTQPLSTPI